MKPHDLKARLFGVMSFSITPFTSEHDLDLDALSRHIEWMSYSGVHQIAVAGATGEFYSLTLDEYRAVICTALRAAGGRVPILIGVGHSTRVATELARCAADEGAAGLLVNPLYQVAPGIEGLYRHHEALANAADLGLIVFSSRDFAYGPDALTRLAEIDHVVGFKDEFGDLGLFLGCIDRLGDRLAWINGMAETYTPAYFAAGATCVTTGLANFAPEIPLTVYRAAAAGDFATCNALIREKVRGLAALRRRQAGYHTAVVKEALDLLGRPVGPCRFPLGCLSAEDRVALALELAALGLAA